MTQSLLSRKPNADKKTLILGATTDPNRYAFLASTRLAEFGHTIINVGLSSGDVAGVPIEKSETIHRDVHTISLYISPANQRLLYNYILGTNPTRIIFNPGAENDELQNLAQAQGIETEYACTLVLLGTSQY